MAQRLIKADVGRHLLRVAPGKIAESILILPLAYPQHHELHFILEQLVEDVVDQVQPLLVGEATDQPDHRHVRVHLEA